MNEKDRGGFHSTALLPPSENTVRPLKAREILAKVNRQEDRIYQLHVDIYQRAEALLSERGRDLEQLEDEERNAFSAFIYQGSENIDHAEFIAMQAKYPDLAEVAVTMQNEGLIDSYKKEEGILKQLKEKHAERLELLARKSLNQLIRNTNYEAILNAESDQRLCAYTLCMLYLPSMNYHAQNLSPSQSASLPLEDRYDAAAWAFDFSEEFRGLLRSQGILPIPISQPVTSENLEQAHATIVSVPELISRIDYHNDITGLIDSELPTIQTPDLFSAIQQFLLKNLQDTTYTPHAIVAIAKRIRETEEGLGNLRKRKTWEDVISPEKIYTLISTLDEEAAEIKKPQEESAVDQIFQRYIVITNQEPAGRAMTVDILKEQRFIELLEQIRQESGPMLPVDERILRSQLVAIHYLFFGSGIEALYAAYIAKLNSSDIPTTPEQIRRVKAELAMNFLSRNIKRNEEISYIVDPDSVTVGFEYEYRDPLENLVYYDLSYVREKRDEMIALMDGLFTEDTVQRAELEKHLRFYTSYIANIEFIVGARTDVKPEEDSLLRQNLVDTPTKLSLATRLGTFSEDTSNYYREMITAPSHSYLLQQRELVQLLLSAGVEQMHINMHMTFGNVELNLERTEVSDILAVLISAGMMESEMSDERARDLIQNGGSAWQETFYKVTRYNGRPFCLPFHFSRDNTRDIEPYPNRRNRSGYEIRSLPDRFGDGTHKAFRARIRAIKYAFLANSAIAAAQKPHFRQTKFDRRLSENYAQFISDWKALLQERVIEYLPLDQRYGELEEVETESGRKTYRYIHPEKYTPWLSRLDAEVHLHPEFAQRVRILISNYNFWARSIIREKTA